MFVYTETEYVLKALGEKLRRARIRKGDTQAIFAARLRVSIPTLRAVEKGSPTVSLSIFLNALSVLGRIEDMDKVLLP
ncbi:helix-turn-helix domain-containing protein [Ferrovum sp.]|uniref:helix-turn-helix domain-containing protein n=1 Tax=Ferrovum sp. TaxID=2609467 RepID=UPI00261C910A|nr:helix-turn-helix domain-containing protein [Ferrovum sp.]